MAKRTKRRNVRRNNSNRRNTRNTRRNNRKQVSKKRNSRKYTKKKRIRKTMRKNMRGGMDPEWSKIIFQNPVFEGYRTVLDGITYSEFVGLGQRQMKQRLNASHEWPQKTDFDTKNFIVKRIVEEVNKYNLLEKLKTGKVYNLDNIKFVPTSAGFEIEENEAKLFINHSCLMYNKSSCQVWKLSMADTDLPLVLKILSGPDKSEEFFARIFKHIPVFNQEWVGGDDGPDDFMNCGIMQSKFLGLTAAPPGGKQYMLLESGGLSCDTSVMDLYDWIIKNKDIPIERYVTLATKILWQIISQVVCLQKYGVFFFDIKSKNIVVIQKGDHVRVMLIDTGGFIFHMPTFLSKIDTLPNKDDIHMEIKDIHFRHGQSILSKPFSDGYLYLPHLSDGEFPASLCPLFLDALDDGLVSPKNLHEGCIFNIFAMGLLANEIVCRNRAGGQRRSYLNFKGLYWRGYDEQGNAPDTEERTQLIDYLKDFDSSPAFAKLINSFIGNWSFFRKEGDHISMDGGIISIPQNLQDEQYLESLSTQIFNPSFLPFLPTRGHEVDEGAVLRRTSGSQLDDSPLIVPG